MAGGEEFVEQVAVAVLQVDEVEALGLGESSGPGVVVDQPLELPILPHRGVVGDADARVQKGVPEGDARRRSRLGGPRPATAVGELQADQRRAFHFRSRTALHRELCGLEQLAPQRPDGRRGLRIDQQLVGVGASVGAHRRRLAAPDPARPRFPEAPPAPPGELRGHSLVGSVPALHRLDHPAVLDPRASRRRVSRRGGGQRERLGQWRVGSGEDFVVAGEGTAELLEPRSQARGVRQRCHPRESHAHGPRSLDGASALTSFRCAWLSLRICSQS